MTLDLSQNVEAIASKTAATFTAIGDIGISGAACVASSLTAVGSASASLSVSVSASASVQGQAG
jgi:hypothetical protein